jgi:hypothetical protein
MSSASAINWNMIAAISGPVLAVVAWIGRVLGRKLDMVGRHLTRQDDAHQLLAERVSRLEGPITKAIDRSQGHMHNE